MPCTKPLKGWFDDKGGFSLSGGKGAYHGQLMEVPCGQCMGCRIAKTNTWATRIMHESMMHEVNAFLTLTYDDDNYPPRGSLVKEHLQKFIRKLRKLLAPQKIRYYACGEYGDDYQRPHYHAIIFNYWPNDAQAYGKERKYGKWYRSDKLNNIWNKGFVGVGQVQYESAAYTAKYITKKITGPSAHDRYFFRLPEFSLMSRRPGIGYDWWKKYQKQTEDLNSVISRGRERSIPLYYKRKLKDESYVKAFKAKLADMDNRVSYSDNDLETMDVYLNEKFKYFTGLRKN